MKTYNALRVDENEIVLSNSKDLDEMFKLLNDDENFILQWNEDGRAISKVIMATNLSAKVKNNEIVLKAEEKQGGL